MIGSWCEVRFHTSRHIRKNGDGQPQKRVYPFWGAPLSSRLCYGHSATRPKYHFGLTLANQVTASIPAQLRQEITSVCGTKICHQLGRDDAAHFAGVLMLRRPDRDSLNSEA